MKIYKFPFEKVERNNAKIILYGMGNVGRQYLSQCIAANNISVLFAVDAHSELSFAKVHDVQVYNPQKISELKDEEFDYIVIAMDHDENAKSIKAFLINQGILEKKIIYSIDYYDEPKYLRSPELYPWHNPSFSWFGEDLVVSGLFKCMGIEMPSYLDVGCNHPYEGNNTALLYLTGSSGINIDANPNCIQLMNRERPEDINICVGICGRGGGQREFFMLGEYDGLNSFSKEYIETYEKSHNVGHGDARVIKVQCLLLADIIESYCGGEFPDYFDLDVEGLDDEVMSSYDFTDNGAKIICVESHSEAVCSQMLSQGYIRYFSTIHNVIYVKKNLIDGVVRM